MIETRNLNLLERKSMRIEDETKEQIGCSVSMVEYSSTVIWLAGVCVMEDLENQSWRP